jgi:hypothetical protein
VWQGTACLEQGCVWLGSTSSLKRESPGEFPQPIMFHKYNKGGQANSMGLKLTVTILERNESESLSTETLFIGIVHIKCGCSC